MGVFSEVHGGCMNTTQVGQAFEKDVLAFFEQLIRDGQFGMIPSGCKVYHQKGYYSRERESNIVFDIAIEVFLPGAAQYIFRFLIECKKYKHAVPVNDIEEFMGKVRQVNGANTKAIMVASSGFQEGVIKYARNNGIGLMRYFSPADFKWVLTRSPSTLPLRGAASRVVVSEALLNESYRSNSIDMFACVGDTYTHSIAEFLAALVGRTLASKVGVRGVRKHLVKYLSPVEIEERAERILASVGYTGGRVPLKKIVEVEREKSGLEFSVERYSGDSANPTLGEISFSPLKITLYGEGEDESMRQRFTLAHELGHYFLDHGKYLVREFRNADDDLDVQVSVPPLREVQRLEWQANYFAACLLLPRSIFASSFRNAASCIDLRNRGFGELYVDQQQCNQQHYFKISSALRYDYGTSRSVVRLRLLGMGLMVEDLPWRKIAVGEFSGERGGRSSSRHRYDSRGSKVDFRRLVRDAIDG